MYKETYMKFYNSLAFLSRVEFDVMLVDAPDALWFDSDTLGHLGFEPSQYDSPSPKFETLIYNHRKYKSVWCFCCVICLRHHVLMTVLSWSVKNRQREVVLGFSWSKILTAKSLMLTWTETTNRFNLFGLIALTHLACTYISPDALWHFRPKVPCLYHQLRLVVSWMTRDENILIIMDGTALDIFIKPLSDISIRKRIWSSTTL